MDMHKVSPSAPAADDLDSERLILRDGTTATVRRSVPSDEAQIVSFFRELSPESRWHRFFAVALPQPELLRRFADSEDPRRSFTLLAFRMVGGDARIIAVASTAGLKGYGYVSAYVAAKHAVIGLVRSLALEVATKGVTVNAVCPGFTETDLLEGSIDNIIKKTGRNREQAVAELSKHNPQGRLVAPSEVADAVVWLCGDGAGAVTGQAIAVAGGEV
jgi:NAD(P)-dependent dehydrogenase (short-subunit alcohol dehydrogenase family)